MMEVLKITEKENGKGALMEISLGEEETRVLLELAVNGILREAINKQEAKFSEEPSDDPDFDIEAPDIAWVNNNRLDG